jgi:hypothetical protein
MRKIALSIAALGVAFTPLLFAAPAHAQATRTWVSGVGDDANPCSRTAPCKTYAGTISKTAANGEINCLDPGGFGSVTITKSLSIVCDYTEGGVLAAGTFGFNINAPAGSLITLKGQDVECVGTGTNGIQVLGVGVTVHVHKTQIRSCRNSGGSNGNGILVAPSSGTAKVLVADSYITDNGGTTSNAGILIKPTGGASANVSVNRVQFEANTNGVFMDGSGGGGASNLTVNDSLMSASANGGVVISSTGGAFTSTISNSTISFNGGAGAAVAGAASTMRLGANTIANNVVGVSNTGGTMQSFKNNMIATNGTDGTPINPVSSGGLILN